MKRHEERERIRELERRYDALEARVREHDRGAFPRAGTMRFGVVGTEPRLYMGVPPQPAVDDITTTTAPWLSVAAAGDATDLVPASSGAGLTVSVGVSSVADQVLTSSSTAQGASVVVLGTNYISQLSGTPDTINASTGDIDYTTNSSIAMEYHVPAMPSSLAQLDAGTVVYLHELTFYYVLTGTGTIAGDFDLVNVTTSTAGAIYSSGTLSSGTSDSDTSNQSVTVDQALVYTITLAAGASGSVKFRGARFDYGTGAAP